MKKGLMEEIWDAGRRWDGTSGCWKKMKMIEEEEDD
jgi:hypothetical protein